MKIRRGFVSNSSTYSYITYIHKDRINEVVYGTAEEVMKISDVGSYYDLSQNFQPIRIRDFGEVLDTNGEFMSFLSEWYEIELPDGLTDDKSPDDYINMEYYDKEEVVRQLEEVLSPLEEFKVMKERGYVAIHVIMNNEGDLANFIGYVNGVPFEGTGGFTVMG